MKCVWMRTLVEAVLNNININPKDVELLPILSYDKWVKKEDKRKKSSSKKFKGKEKKV